MPILYKTLNANSNIFEFVPLWYDLYHHQSQGIHLWLFEYDDGASLR
jgi:hypothetical protein